MEIDEGKIFLTYELGGKYLVKRGKYKAAKVKAGKEIKYDCGIIGPECIVTKAMQVEEPPKYEKATQSLPLGKEFIEMALTRPKCPFKYKDNAYFKWLRSPRGKFYAEFNKLSDEVKIKKQLEFLVEDLTGSVGNKFTYELI